MLTNKKKTFITIMVGTLTIAHVPHHDLPCDLCICKLNEDSSINIAREMLYN